MLNNNMDFEGDISRRPVISDLSDYGLQYSKQLADARSLNFTTSLSEGFDDVFTKSQTPTRDPKSHRIIEKKRRDRMNNYLADLSKLIPTHYSKQGRGRIEKTEIIQMAITHIKNLTNMVNKQASQVGTLKSNLPDRYLGFKECQDEVMRCLVEVEGWDAADRLCIMLMSHLEQAGEKFRIMNDQSLSQVAKEEQYRHADEDMNQQPTGMRHALNPSGQQTEFTTTEGYQIAKSYETKSFQQEGTISPPIQNLEDINGNPPTYPGYEQLLTAQQITQEHVKRDTHMWTLLRSRSSQRVEDSGISVESEMSTSKNKDSRKARHLKNRAQYDQSSVFTSSPQESCSEKMATSVYKFKHSITNRFSQEERRFNKSSSSSSSFREEKRKNKPKRKIRHARSTSPSSSGSSNYSISSNSNNNSSSQGSSKKAHEEEKSQDVLPGFILHPNGPHYIPLSIHPSSVGANIFNNARSCIYHPISIPVNFGGPVLRMTKVTVQQVKSEDPNQSTELSMDSTSGCSSMNSADNSSDSSPTPEQEMNKPGVRC